MCARGVQAMWKGLWGGSFWGREHNYSTVAVVDALLCWLCTDSKQDQPWEGFFTRTQWAVGTFELEFVLVERLELAGNKAQI